MTQPIECNLPWIPATRGGSFLRWDDSDRYEPGFHIGSQSENGEHIRDASGWPYSIYRMARAIGATDVVICHGIQCHGDAIEIARQIAGLA